MLQVSLWAKTVEPFIKSAAFFQPIRTTYILKRRFEAPLRTTARPQGFRKRHRIYEVVQDHKTKTESKMITLLLEKYVGDLGGPGEIVTVDEKKARLILLTKSASYLTDENLARCKELLAKVSAESYSSKFAGATLMELQRLTLNITMNKEEPWTVEPWHIRASFRKAFVNVPEYAITMPRRPISGPDLNLEDKKEFYITVKINNKESANVKCRIHHWATDIYDRLPVVKKHNEIRAELLFPEDKEYIPEKPVTKLV